MSFRVGISLDILRFFQDNKTWYFDHNPSNNHQKSHIKPLSSRTKCIYDEFPRELGGVKG